MKDALFRDLRGLNYKGPDNYTTYGSRKETYLSAYKAQNVRKSPSGFVGAFHSKLTPFQLQREGKLTTFSLGEYLYILQKDLMYRYQPKNESLTIVYQFDASADITDEWSVGIFAGKVILANKNVDHWVFEITSDSNLVITSKISELKTDIQYVTSFKNRLVYVTSDGVGWSELDVPTNIKPDNAKGIGIQSLKLVSGVLEPQGLGVVGDRLLVFTSKGILQLTSVARVIPFTFSVLAGSEMALLGSGVFNDNIAGMVLIGTPAGIYSISKGVDELDSALNQYLESEYFNQYGKSVTLSVDKDRFELFISIEAVGKTLVYNLVDKTLTECTTFNHTLGITDYQGADLILSVNDGRLNCSESEGFSLQGSIKTPTKFGSFNKEPVKDNVSNKTYTKIEAHSFMALGQSLKEVAHKKGFDLKILLHKSERKDRLKTSKPETTENIGSFTTNLNQGSNTFDLNKGTYSVDYNADAILTKLDVYSGIRHSTGAKEISLVKPFYTQRHHPSLMAYHVLRPTPYSKATQSFRLRQIGIHTNETYRKPTIIPYDPQAQLSVVEWDPNSTLEIIGPVGLTSLSSTSFGSALSTIPVDGNKTTEIKADSNLIRFKAGSSGSQISIEVSNIGLYSFSLSGVGVTFDRSGLR